MITNKHNIHLPIAIFLAHDDYDYVKNNPNYLSVTTLLKPIKSLVLQQYVQDTSVDLIDLIPSRVGTSIHSRVEEALNNFHKNATKLGIADCGIAINPDDRLHPNAIFMEQRKSKEIFGYTIGGKFDIVYENTLRDIKTTKVYKWIKGDFEDYILQGSIYRWLNQDIIHEDFMYIDFLFTDWKEHETSKEGYPPLPIMHKKLPLKSIKETEHWIITKLIQLVKWSLVTDQSLLPKCTTKERWQDPDTYAYYKNPNGKRATKIFSSMSEAVNAQIQHGSVGRIEVREATPRRCNSRFCPAYSVCEQGKN